MMQTHAHEAKCEPRLRIENQDYFDNTVAFAKKIGMYEPPSESSDSRGYLKERLDTLERFAESFGGEGGMTVLYPDMSPFSFGFTVLTRKGNTALIGGLLFHGSHDGYGSGSGPTFAVSLTPTEGWAIHT